jgi:hypothetical protein
VGFCGAPAFCDGGGFCGAPAFCDGVGFCDGAGFCGAPVFCAGALGDAVAEDGGAVIDSVADASGFVAR